MIKLHYLLLFMLVAVSNGQAAVAEHQMERFTRQVTISKPTTIKIINPYGDIRIRKADDDQFIYHGVAQSHHLQQVSLDFVQEKDQIIATIVYSKPEEISEVDRYDLALVVPPMASLEIEIESGKLSTKGLGSAIKATSVGSDMQIKTSGPVELFSQNGSIDLQIKPTEQKIRSSIKTHQGHVNVLFFEDMPRFEVKTGGYITSNSVPLLTSKNKEQRTAFYGDINNNHYLMIQTDTGQVSLIDLAH